MKKYFNEIESLNDTLNKMQNRIAQIAILNDVYKTKLNELTNNNKTDNEIELTQQESLILSMVNSLLNNISFKIETIHIKNQNELEELSNCWNLNKFNKIVKDHDLDNEDVKSSLVEPLMFAFKKMKTFAELSTYSSNENINSIILRSNNFIIKTLDQEAQILNGYIELVTNRINQLNSLEENEFEK